MFVKYCSENEKRKQVKHCALLGVFAIMRKNTISAFFFVRI